MKNLTVLNIDDYFNMDDEYYQGLLNSVNLQKLQMITDHEIISLKHMTSLYELKYLNPNSLDMNKNSIDNTTDNSNDSDDNSNDSNDSDNNSNDGSISINRNRYYEISEKIGIKLGVKIESGFILPLNRIIFKKDLIIL